MDKRFVKVQEEEKPRPIIPANRLTYEQQNQVIEKASKTENINHRILILEKYFDRVAPDSRPYFTYLINKYRSKAKGCWTTSYNSCLCPLSCNGDHVQQVTVKTAEKVETAFYDDQNNPMFSGE